jgi:hypothetical protein
VNLQPSDFLAWIPSISAIIALTALIYNYKRNPRKSLSYEVPISDRLVNIDKSIKSRIKVLFDEVEVPEVSIIHVKIVNTGNTPIAEKDYATPVEIRFGKDAKILQSTLGATFPKDIPAAIANEGDRLTFKPVLLNSEDYVLIKAYVTQVEEVRVSGRIEGVKLISKRAMSDPGHPFHYKSRFWLLILLASSLLTAILKFTSLERWAIIPLSVVLIILIAINARLMNFYGDQFEKWVVKSIENIQNRSDK